MDLRLLNKEALLAWHTQRMSELEREIKREIKRAIKREIKGEIKR